MAKPVGDKNFERMPDSHPNGGWKCNDEELVALQRGIVWDLLKQVGQNLTSGVSVINITMPVTIFEPRSYLERICDSWCYGPVFLTKAAQEDDPVERMKLVATFALSGLSNTCSMRKPFNPILGETYEANFDDGSTVLCEQSSHHPPVTNWQVFGPAELYHLYGFGEWSASFYANSVKGQQKGDTTIEFNDGTKITYSLPHMWLKGVTYGERIVEYEGIFKFRDQKNRIGCDLVINPEGQGWFSGWGWGSKPKKPSDYFIGSVFRSSSDNLEDEAARTVICNAEGTWLGALEFDGKTYWDWQMGMPKFSPVPVDKPLPSDSRFRTDLIALAKGDIELATKCKTELENKQRAEAKLRQEGKNARAGPSAQPAASSSWF